MRKEIPITNYKPEVLKQIRTDFKITDKMLEDIDDVDVNFIKEIEQAKTPLAVDIFYLAFLYETYKEIISEDDATKLPRFTADILFPHPEGLQYQEDIVKSPNFKGMPITRNGEGKISWVTTKDTDLGKKRIAFWEKKRVSLGIKANHVMDSGIRQKVAFKNHPTKKHTCLFTGKELSIEYRYPAPSRVDMLNSQYSEELKYYDKDILEVATYLYEIDNCQDFCEVMGIKKQPESLDELLQILQNGYIEIEKSPYVSPGVMSNSPDRLDGYHSYNADIRDIIDTGRNKDNLKRYTQDRRVYEMWSGGDWKQADRLYATFTKHGVSPDHIGPMSLGFAHRAKFRPMTQSENSSKGNRMSLKDVQVLIADEKAGEEVITWHSKYIWDKLKNEVKSDTDAKALSTLMRTNLHHVLIILSMIYEEGHKDFLMQFLNPEYSYYDYEFIGFNSEEGTYKDVKQMERRGKNQENNAKRYERKAFESLVTYQDKKNRNNKKWDSKEIDKDVSSILELLNNKKDAEAKKQLHLTLENLSKFVEL